MKNLFIQKRCNTIDKLLKKKYNTDDKIKNMKLDDIWNLGNLSNDDIINIKELIEAIKNKNVIAFFDENKKEREVIKNVIPGQKTGN